MQMLPDDNDYACFVDGDACFTTNVFGKQLEDIVSRYPECGLFTARTNRIACKYQRAGDWSDNDMSYHRGFGKECADLDYSNIKDISDVGKKEVMGGVLILIRKAIWNRLGGFHTKGMLGVDNDIHWRAMAHKEKVYLMMGVYMMHWYRGGNIHDKKHLL